MAMIGSIECFKGTGEEFGMYLERIEHLFKVNKVEMNMKVSLFITLAGPQVYCTLKVEMNMKVSLFITLAGPQVYCTLKNLMARGTTSILYVKESYGT
ncbi:hypothetical protein QE152_g27635 [Popillia japonica]|uniref:Uncharacterized protein n=1 Tax=Popillia japonica TaxID=7064 RepID=A0AAW1JU22_POPJA